MEASNKVSYRVLSSVMKDVIEQHDTLLFAEWRKCQLIILAYRLAAVAVGVVLLVLGYLLFSSSVIDSEDIKNYYFNLERIMPSVVLATFGLLFIIIGVAKLMPLPRFEKPGERLGTTKQAAGFPVEDGIPVLTNDEIVMRRDKVWNNNVKPLMVKIANHEDITSVDRDLLRKWLHNA